MNPDFLKAFMRMHGDSHDDLAKLLNIHPKTLYKKMGNKKQEFTQSEIAFIADRYQLTADDIKMTFFAGQKNM